MRGQKFICLKIDERMCIRFDDRTKNKDVIVADDLLYNNFQQPKRHILISNTIRKTTTATMSNLNPTGPSQPPLDDVYKTSGNPADKEPAEAASADRTSASNAPIA